MRFSAPVKKLWLGSFSIVLPPPGGGGGETLWDRRLFCCLVSRQGRRIPILRVTSRLILSLLPRRLVQLRFLVCLLLRGNFLFSKPHSRNPPRNLLCRRRRKIQILTPLLTIVSVKIACLPCRTLRNQTETIPSRRGTVRLLIPGKLVLEPTTNPAGFELGK